MRRHLIIFALIAALSAGGAAGTLAAALCAREGAGASEHACCRTENKENVADATNESCPALAHKQADSQVAHDGAHAEKQTHAEKETHAARQATVAEAARGARLVSPQGCAHCVGDAGTPPAAFKLRDAGTSRRGAEEVAPRATPNVRHTYDSFTPQVTPTQGAPPGRAARRHVLISVFLI